VSQPPNTFLSTDNVQRAYNQQRSFAFLWTFTKSKRSIIYCALAALFVGSLVGVYSSRFLGTLVEDGLVHRNWAVVRKLGFGILLLEVFSLALSFFGRTWLAVGALESVYQIRRTLFDHLQNLPIRYFDRQPLGRTVTRLTYDVESLEDFFQGTFSRMIQATFILISVFIAMIVTRPAFGLAIAATALPAIFATVYYRKPILHWNRELSKRGSAINAKLSEFINGLPVIRSFGLESWSQNKFDAKIVDQLDAGLQTNYINAVSRPITLFFSTFPILFIILWGGSLVEKGLMSLGLFVTYVRYSERFSRPIFMLAQEIHQIQTAMASAERVTTFLNEDVEAITFKKVDSPTRLSKVQGDIEFEGVGMTYDGAKMVLSDVNFKIQAGSVVGLAGETGSGKTSTVSLLSRLYPYQKGFIRIDGVAIEDMDRHWLRSQIGFVSQDVVIFKGSIRENLRMGYDVEDSQLIAAAQKTGLWQRLRDTGRGLDNLIYTNGTNLSAGEIQLISLTRILISNPAILIMDEATANIDPELEHLIHEAVHEVFRGRTCLLIAHRLSTLKNCDRILVFRQGNLAEEGSHQELVHQGGYYASLVKKGESIGAPA
jgi:ABC-type multidrug transport system fused ATPase/permease subunit